MPDTRAECAQEVIKRCENKPSGQVNENHAAAAAVVSMAFAAAVLRLNEHQTSARRFTSTQAQPTMDSAAASRCLSIPHWDGNVAG